jgi:hypothetical protein
MKAKLGMRRARGRTGARAAISLIGALWLSAVFAMSAEAVAPQLTSVRVSGVTSTSVVLEAEVNSQGKATKYRFDYGTEPCGAHPCTSVPVPEGELPAGSSPVPIKATIEGLSASTLYHFRVVANNGETTTGSDHLFATYSPTFTGLPDGRAYEQASPTDKDGGDAQGTIATVKATPEGDGVTFGSTFGIPGGKAAQALPTFLASRSSGSWSTQGLLPPVATGERAKAMGWSPDFSELFSKTTKLGNPRTQALFGQSTTTQELIQIAPYLSEAEYFYAGSSTDGSTVLFESDKALPGVSGALEDHPNLYAWDRASGEVRLASAMNTQAESEAALPKGAFAGPYAWSLGSTAAFLRLGGAERSSYLQDMHAVTPGGSAYFTAAGSAQLYLRENPTKAQSPLNGQGECADPTLACTIHVSASQKTNGQGENGTDTVGPQPAAFQAASADGSEVFFTSHEKLTNDANTGEEQQKAAISRTAITGGSIKDPSFIPKAAVGVTVDGSHVYWANPAVGAIGRADLNGENVDDTFIAVPDGECEVEFKVGEEETVEFKKVSIPGTPRYVAVDGEHLYWTNTGLIGEEERPVDGGGTIGRANLNGEASSVDPDFICGDDPAQPGKRFVSNPQGIAVNATHIYWANAANEGLNRSIARAATNGTGVEERLAKPSGSGIPNGVALSATHVYFSNEEVANNFAYISRVPLEGGEEEFVFVGEAGVRGVAVDGTHVYWASQSAGAIGRADLELKTKENTWLPINGKANGLTADATHLYLSVNGESATNPGNDLYRYLPATRALSDLTALPGGNGAEVQGVLGVSADGSYVYFVANGILAAGATQGTCKGPVRSSSGECSLYALHEGQVAFVARLDADGNTSSDSLDWVGTPRDVFSTSSYVPKTSFLGDGGKTLVFRSQEKLSEYDNEGVPEYYRYRAETKALSCLTCRPTLEAVRQGPSLGSLVFPALSSSDAIEAVNSRNLSADGNRFFFETAEALSPEDTNGVGGCPFSGAQNFPACLDVYEWEAPNTPGGSCKEGSPAYSTLNDGCIYLISTGKSKFPSLFADASESGNDVFFFTRQSLVGQDKDELQDVYDAGAGGGLTSQNQTPPVPCEGSEACHGPDQVPPAESTPATPTFAGPGNQAEKHKKQKTAKKKKHKKHKKQQHKKAKNKGRSAR